MRMCRYEVKKCNKKGEKKERKKNNWLEMVIHLSAVLYDVSSIVGCLRVGFLFQSGFSAWHRLIYPRMVFLWAFFNELNRRYQKDGEKKE